MKKNKEKNIDIKVEEEKDIRTFQNLVDFIKESKVMIVLLCVFTLAIYINIMGGDFVNLDNLSVALETTPNYTNFWKAFREVDGPGMMTSLIYSLFGVSSSAFHVVTILQHMVNGILVFLLLRILFGKKVALISTFLFLAHPANTEAVSWHAGQIYVMRANLMLPILIFFALYKKSKQNKYLVASSVIFLVSMIFFQSQGWMFITPLLVVLMDQFIFEEKIKFKNILSYIPILIISLIFAAMLIPGFLKGRISDLSTLYYVDTESATPLVNRIPYTIYMEFKTLVYPMTLSIYHEGKYITPLEYTFMVVVTIMVIYGIFYFLKKDRRISGLLLMILFAILPSFSPVIIAWIAAERYLYIPSIFSSAIIALGLVWMEGKILERKKKAGKGRSGKIETNFILYSSIIIILLYSVRTVFRNNDLRNSKNLWIATRKTAPYSYRVYNNMGDVLANEGDLEGALENFKRSFALKPDYADAVHNIGHIYMVQRNYPQAKRYLEQSLEMNPRLFPSAYKLGIIYMEERDLNKAKEYFEKCLSVEPTNADCVSSLTTLNKLMGN